MTVHSELGHNSGTTTLARVGLERAHAYTAIT